MSTNRARYREVATYCGTCYKPIYPLRDADFMCEECMRVICEDCAKPHPSGDGAICESCLDELQANIA